MGGRWKQVALLLGIVLMVQSALAQGCSQCRDTVSQTNPAIQSSYRTAILILIVAASGVSAGVAFVFRRMR